MRDVLNRDEHSISDALIAMGKSADLAIEGALRSLRELDEEAALGVVDGDESINKQYSSIVEKCFATIATQQPVASDLRELLAEMHIAIELERIADHAADVARIVTEFGERGPVVSPEELAAMGDACRVMLQRAMDAYAERDEDMAIAVADEDQAIDLTQRKLTNHIIHHLCDDSQRASRGARCLWIVRHLERIADRVTNICEQIVFLKTGQMLDLNRPAPQESSA